MRVALPPTTDAEWRRKLLAPVLSPSALVSAEWRRACTRFQPLRFAMIYLPHYLDPLQTGSSSISEMHVAIATSLQLLSLPGDHPSGAFREWWVAPREGAKSTHGSVVGPLWAAAHGHRAFPLIFSMSDPAAAAHGENIRHELRSNELLLRDFPHLRLSRGTGSSNSKQRITTAGGRTDGIDYRPVTMVFRGIEAGTAGLRAAEQRPDLIVLDDIEPKAEVYSPDAAAKRLAIVTDDILPMGRRAAVIGLGTTTMHGCISHHVASAARGNWTDDNEWVRAERFTPQLWTAILDEGTEDERSQWPTQWSLEWLKNYRATAPRSYARSYGLDPLAAGGKYWRESHFIIKPAFHATRHVVSIDVATTKRKTSDHTAIAVIGADPGRSRAIVEQVWSGRVSGSDLRRRVLRLCSNHPTITEIIVEVNQGGDLWEENVLTGMPVPVHSYYAKGHKSDRIENLLFQYEEGKVYHRDQLGELQMTMLAYPEGRDDMLDAVAAGVRKVLT